MYVQTAMKYVFHLLDYSTVSFTFEPGHEKMCLMSYPRSLISAFVVQYLDSTISPDSIAEISRL